jgi:hypothetical protein
MIDLDLLRDLVRSRAEELCGHFFPHGKKEGNEWKIGDISGTPGESLGIQLTGQKAGLYHDRATGEGGDFITLLRENRNITFPQAIAEIERAFGKSLQSMDQRSYTVNDYQASDIQKANSLALDGIQSCSDKDLLQLSKLRGIPVEGLQIAVKRNLLFAHENRFQGRCWVVTDDARRNAICRRLNGKRFRFREATEEKAEGPKSKCWKGSDANWPIGIAQANKFPTIPFCEGAPDFLAAFYLAWAGGVEHLVAPVCMTGSSCKIHEDALPLFRGRRVRIFGHTDEAGQQATTKWAEQLRSVEAEVDGFNFVGLFKPDGRPVKDLNDLLFADHNRSGCGIEITTGAFDFAFQRH